MTFTLSETSIVDALKNDETISEKSKEICNDIIREKYDITNIVENLGFALTSPTIELRVNGTKLLSNILKNLPSDYLNEKQLKFIVEFYCDRLKDHHNVIPPILDGILALSKMEMLPDGSSQKLFHSFLQNTTCQNQVRDDRKKIYYILQSMTERHCEELKSMQADFIYGVINSIEGERDPHNLLFLFQFMPKFLKMFPLYHLSEEMFETFACYFPIDFQPIKNDENIITRDELANNLANCLIASDEFIEWTVSLLIEKLGSDLIQSKLDSLDLLRRSANRFSSDKLEKYFDDIWNSLKSEIFPGSDNKKIIIAGLEALQAILVNAYENGNGSNANDDHEISKNLQSKILSTILMHLNDPNHRLFEPATKIGLVCVYADPLYAGTKILNSLILKLHNEDDNDETNNENNNSIETIEENTKILNLISQILYLCNLKNILNKFDSELCKKIENEFIKILNYASNTNLNVNNLEFIKILLNCITEAISILNDDYRKLFYKFLIKILIDDKNDVDLRGILKKLHKNFHNELKENINNEILNDFKSYSLHIKEKIYLNFSIFIKINEFDDIVLNLIMNNIFENSQLNDIKIALNALKMILLENENNVDDLVINKLLMNYNLIDQMIKLARLYSENYEILSVISSILCSFIKQLNLNEQNCILKKYLNDMNLKLASDLYITKGLLGFINENIEIQEEHFDMLLNNLTKLSLESDDKDIRKVCHHLLCTLLNKIDHKNEIKNNILRKCIEKLKEEIKMGNHKAVEVLSWISKGLLVQGHPDAAELIELLAELLDHPTLSNTASLAFEILSFEFPELHLPIVKFLFKQKFFHIVLNKIWNKLSVYSENHMNAFIYVLKMTPHRVLKMNIEKIGPVLFKCLETEKNTTVQVALEIFKNFLNEQDEYFRNHFQHLIPQLLKLSSNQTSMKIRISSIECLEVLTKYPTFILLPYKHDVSYGLIPALDDKKRLVRNAAVKARNIWLLIG